MKKTRKILSIILLNTFIIEYCISIKPVQASVVINPSEQTLSLLSTPIPSSAAFIETQQLVSKNKLIYMIQDAHTNPSAQENIAKTLDTLLSSGKIDKIFVEAGFGNQSLSFLRKYGSSSQRLKAAKPYLKTGELQGEEYLDLISDKSFTIWGVEDMTLYRESIEIYRQIVQKREFFKNYLSRINTTLTTLESHFLNRRLLDLLSKSKQYHSGELALTEYLDLLSPNQNAEFFPYLQALAEIKTLESKINFQEVNVEAKLAMETLSPEDRETLSAALSKPAHKLMGDNRFEQAAFTLICEKLKKEKFEALFQYASYLQKVQNLDYRELNEELDRLEKIRTDELSTSQEEKDFVACHRVLERLNQLFSLEATPDQMADTRALSLRWDLEHLTGFLNGKIAEKNQYYERVLFLDENFSEFVGLCEKFYALTQSRDEAFLRNIQNNLDERAVFIVGGYHAPSLQKLFKEAKISYVSIVPQVLRETNQKKYEELLLGADSKPVLVTAGARFVDVQPLLAVAGSGARLGRSALLENVFSGVEGADALKVAQDIAAHQQGARLAGKTQIERLHQIRNVFDFEKNRRSILDKYPAAYLIETADIIQQLQTSLEELESKIEVSISENTRRIREEQGRTIQSLADHSDIAYMTISKIERRTSNGTPSFEMQTRLAKVLKVRVEDICPYRTSEVDPTVMLKQAIEDGKNVFGKILWVVCDAYDLSESQIGREAKVNQQHISKAVTGREELAVASIIRVSEAVKKLTHQVKPFYVWKSLEQYRLRRVVRFIDQKVGQYMRTRREKIGQTRNKVAAGTILKDSGSLYHVEAGNAGYRSDRTLTSVADALGESVGNILDSARPLFEDEKRIEEKIKKNRLYARNALIAALDGSDLNLPQISVEMNDLNGERGLSASMLHNMKSKEDVHITPKHAVWFAQVFGEPIGSFWPEEDLIYVSWPLVVGARLAEEDRSEYESPAKYEEAVSPRKSPKLVLRDEAFAEFVKNNAATIYSSFKNPQERMRAASTIATAIFESQISPEQAFAVLKSLTQALIQADLTDAELVQMRLMVADGIEKKLNEEMSKAPAKSLIFSRHGDRGFIIKKIAQWMLGEDEKKLANDERSSVLLLPTLSLKELQFLAGRKNEEIGIYTYRASSGKTFVSVCRGVDLSNLDEESWTVSRTDLQFFAQGAYHTHGILKDREGLNFSELQASGDFAGTGDIFHAAVSLAALRQSVGVLAFRKNGDFQVLSLPIETIDPKVIAELQKGWIIGGNIQNFMGAGKGTVIKTAAAVQRYSRGVGEESNPKLLVEMGILAESKVVSAARLSEISKPLTDERALKTQFNLRVKRAMIAILSADMNENPADFLRVLEKTDIDIYGQMKRLHEKIIGNINSSQTDSKATDMWVSQMESLSVPFVLYFDNQISRIDWTYRRYEDIKDLDTQTLIALILTAMNAPQKTVPQTFISAQEIDPKINRLAGFIWRQYQETNRKKIQSIQSAARLSETTYSFKKPEGFSHEEARKSVFLKEFSERLSHIVSQLDTPIHILAFAQNRGGNYDSVMEEAQFQLGELSNLIHKNIGREADLQVNLSERVIVETLRRNRGGSGKYELPNKAMNCLALIAEKPLSADDRELLLREFSAIQSISHSLTFYLNSGIDYPFGEAEGRKFLVLDFDNPLAQLSEIIGEMSILSGKLEMGETYENQRDVVGPLLLLYRRALVQNEQLIQKLSGVRDAEIQLALLASALTGFGFLEYSMMPAEVLSQQSYQAIVSSAIKASSALRNLERKNSSNPFSPVVPAMPSVERPIESAPKPAVTFKKVLIVDDEEPLRRIMRMTLVRMGVKDGDIVEVAHSSEALEALKNSEPFDLIITDNNTRDSKKIEGKIYMGLDVIGVLRQGAMGIQTSSRVPVIFISGDTSNPEFKSALGINTVALAKPFSPGDLQRYVNKLAAELAYPELVSGFSQRVFEHFGDLVAGKAVAVTLKEKTSVVVFEEKGNQIQIRIQSDPKALPIELADPAKKRPSSLVVLSARQADFALQTMENAVSNALGQRVPETLTKPLTIGFDLDALRADNDRTLETNLELRALALLRIKLSSPKLPLNAVLNSSDEVLRARAYAYLATYKNKMLEDAESFGVRGDKIPIFKKAVGEILNPGDKAFEDQICFTNNFQKITHPDPNSKVLYLPVEKLSEGQVFAYYSLDQLAIAVHNSEGRISDSTISAWKVISANTFIDNQFLYRIAVKAGLELSQIETIVLKAAFKVSVDEAVSAARLAERHVLASA